MHAQTHTQLLERPKSRMLKTPNATEDMEQQEFLSIPGGNTKWYKMVHMVGWKYLENILAVSYKAKHTL